MLWALHQKSWRASKMVRFQFAPIAGTRPRGQTQDEDERLEEELLADPKERSEHLMLMMIWVVMT